LRQAGGARDAVGWALLAALGIAAGTIIRSQVAAAIIVFAWAFSSRAPLDALAGPTVPYLPFQAATSLAGAALPGGSTPLPCAGSAAIVARRGGPDHC
jgi:hypothetical protein